METLALFASIGIVSLIAAMSPGPDFIVVTKNSLSGSRKTGVLTAIGVGLGILTHVVYSLLGIGLIISQSILIFSIIKFLGAIYLIYLGVKLLLSKRTVTAVTHSGQTTTENAETAFREGFFTNSLNPKATLFFLGIFTQVISPETPLEIQFLLGLEVALIVMAWFTSLALLITYDPIKKNFSKFHHYLNKVMGASLLYFGAKLAIEK